MIQILDKKDCTGCHACVQRCPRACISMHEDEEGFLYPRVDEDRCTRCGLCERVCPVIHQALPAQPLASFAAWNEDAEVRCLSSSGGIFSLLAESIIRRGGVVFGAAFAADWSVEHRMAHTIEGIAAFRGSKYVQSRIGDTYRQAENLLKQGREVLFSGTPCQIAGLKLFLRKPYDNLTTVDFICHGVPSPAVFRTYLSEVMHKAAQPRGRNNTVSSHPIPPFVERDGLCPHASGMEIKSIAFRDKAKGWKKYSFSLKLSKAEAAGEKNTVSLSQTLRENPFMQGFLANLYLRPSCHACPAKCLKSGSDITMADFWQIARVFPQLSDDKGISAVVASTPRGELLLSQAGAHIRPVPYAAISRGNSALLRPCAIPPRRQEFFRPTGEDFHTKVARLARKPLKRRLVTAFKRPVLDFLSATGLLVLMYKCRNRLSGR